MYHQWHIVQAVVYPGDESGYVAECLNLAVVTQGKTLKETVENLREAIQLHLDDEDLEEIRLRPTISIEDEWDVWRGSREGNGQ